METKAFPLRVVLSVTTGRLLTQPRGEHDNGISDLYEILGWMTEDEPFTHQLGRFIKECAPWLKRWFPELKAAESGLVVMDALRETGGAAGMEAWLISIADAHGLKASYDVPRIPRDDHERKDAIAEAVEKFGADRVKVMEIPEKDGA